MGKTFPIKPTSKDAIEGTWYAAYWTYDFSDGSRRVFFYRDAFRTRRGAQRYLRLTTVGVWMRMATTGKKCTPHISQIRINVLDTEDVVVVEPTKSGDPKRLSFRI